MMCLQDEFATVDYSSYEDTSSRLRQSEGSIPSTPRSSSASWSCVQDTDGGEVARCLQVDDRLSGEGRLVLLYSREDEVALRLHKQTQIRIPECRSMFLYSCWDKVVPRHTASPRPGMPMWEGCKENAGSERMSKYSRRTIKVRPSSPFLRQTNLGRHLSSRAYST